MTEEQLSSLTINYLTEQQYQHAKENNLLNPNELYLTNDTSNGENDKVGVVKLYAGQTAPDGWMLCDGSELSRTKYKDLFNVIGTAYGGGDGSTTFNIPNIKGRIPVGLDSDDTDFNTLGKKLGSKFLQAHTHALANYVLAHGYNTGWNVVNQDNGFWGSDDAKMRTTSSGTGDSGNIQPSIVLNYIIRVIDTYPIQTEVVKTLNISGENYVPNVDAINERFTYSYNEHIVGAWVDGRPVYAKTYLVHLSSTDNQALVSHNINNLDFVIDYHGCWKNSSERRQIPQHHYSSNEFDLSLYIVNATNLVFAYGDWVKARASYDYYVTIQYTKTTDQPITEGSES